MREQQNEAQDISFQTKLHLVCMKYFGPSGESPTVTTLGDFKKRELVGIPRSQTPKEDGSSAVFLTSILQCSLVAV